MAARPPSALIPAPKGNQRALGNPGRPSGAELEADTQKVLEKMREGDNALRIRRWCMQPEQEGGLGWSTTHTQTIMERARKVLVLVTRETAEETRARLLAIAERGLDEVSIPLTYHGHRIIDPETGKGLYRVDHFARINYLTFIADLGGLRKTVIQERDNAQRPAQEMTNYEIDAEIERMESELANRATPAEVVSVEDAAPEKTGKKRS